MEGNRDKQFLRLFNEHCKNMMLVDLDVAHSVREMVDELVNIKELLVSRNKKGKMLVKLGLACLAFPEPIASNIAGGVLLALGCCMGKTKKSIDIRDVVEAVRELRYSLAFHV